jgi:hypothetical protein
MLLRMFSTEVAVRAEQPSQALNKAVIHWCTSPGVEEVGGEIGEAGAVATKRLGS